MISITLINSFPFNHAEGVIFPLGICRHVSEPERPRVHQISAKNASAPNVILFPLGHLCVCVCVVVACLCSPMSFTYHIVRLVKASWFMIDCFFFISRWLYARTTAPPPSREILQHGRLEVRPKSNKIMCLTGSNNVDQIRRDWERNRHCSCTESIYLSTYIIGLDSFCAPGIFIKRGVLRCRWCNGL